jgi:hypothetical protein
MSAHLKLKHEVHILRILKRLSNETRGKENKWIEYNREINLFILLPTGFFNLIIKFFKGIAKRLPLSMLVGQPCRKFPNLSSGNFI